MWFYGMVGNSQFRDPWLDEAFASWAETVVDGPRGLVDQRAISLDGPVGGSMADYADDRSYFTLVYDKGGAALLAARDAAGPDAFDAAIRCYVDANAWSIATPDDVGAALADLPGRAAGRRSKEGRPGRCGPVRRLAPSSRGEEDGVLTRRRRAAAACA